MLSVKMILRPSPRKHTSSRGACASCHLCVSNQLRNTRATHAAHPVPSAKNDNILSPFLFRFSGALSSGDGKISFEEVEAVRDSRGRRQEGGRRGM